MRVVLVGPQLEENLSLGYLKAALDRAGHSCSILAFNREADVRRTARAILRRRPDLVGLSLVAQRRYPEYQHLVARLRTGGFAGHLTAGGHFAGLRAEEVLRDTPGLDTVLHHDGEERLVRLIEALGAGCDLRPGPPPDLDGISWRAPDGAIAHRPASRVGDLDDLPHPARRRASRTLGYPFAPMVTSRGCSGTCSFCSIHAWHRQVPRGRLRFRSPRGVAEEMIALHRAHGTRVFIFHDDDFIHPDPREARARCRAILDPVEREIGPFAFVVKCRPDDVEEDLFAYLKVRGLVRAYVGIESHSRAGLRALNRRVDPETNERALATLRSLDVYACFNLLIFHPDSTPAELDENLAFLERHVDVPFDVARAELYARSALEERMLREGRARGDYRGYDYRIADPEAEAAFRLFSALLWERHFGEASILHRSQELGYRLSVLRRLQPRMVTPELEGRVVGLIRAVNRDTVEHLRSLLAAASGLADGWAVLPALGSADPQAFRPAGLEAMEAIPSARAFRRDVAERVRAHTRTWRRLSRELEGRARLGRFAERAERFARVDPIAIERFARLTPGAVLLLGASCGIGDDTEVCDPPPPPIFQHEIEPTLNAVCAVPACHSGASPAAGLTLETGKSYDALVNVPSTQVPRLRRVQPHQADSSYVVHKLEGTQLQVGGSGERMPKEGSVLPAFVANLRHWIAQGASRVR